MGPPRAFRLVALDLLRSGPALGRAQHDHRPARALRLARRARLLLDGADLGHDPIQRGRHGLVHARGVVSLHEQRRVAVAAQQGLELLVGDAGEDRRVGDLVAVEVQDGQDGAVARRVEELVRVPGGGQWSRLRLAVPHHAGHDEVGVVEGHAVGVGEAVTELAALVDGAGRLGGDVAADVAGERELLEELLHPRRVFALVRVHLRVGPLEIGGAEHARRAVAGAGHEDDVEIVPLDHAVEVRPDEGERGARAPVAEQPVLDVLHAERLAQQRVVAQVDHADGQVVARAPPGVELAQLVGRQGRGGAGRRTKWLSHSRVLTVSLAGPRACGRARRSRGSRSGRGRIASGARPRRRLRSQVLLDGAMPSRLTMNVMIPEAP